MDFDVILQEIGEFGKFQSVNYFLICLPVLFCAANSLSFIFTARVPNYRCIIDECNDDQYNQPWVKDVIPGEVSKSSGFFVPEHCTRYKFVMNDSISVENGTCLAHWFEHEKIQCNKFIFEESERTIVNDWQDELTCDENKWKLALVGSSHYAGIIIGTAAFGFLADMFGRKKIFIVSIIAMSLTGIGQALANGYITFIAFALLNAVGTAGVYPLAFVLGLEMVGKRKREMAGVVLNYFYSIGEALVGIIAWLDGDWVNLQLWVSAPSLIFICYYWIIPESARWLIAKKLNVKALEVIKRVARENGAELSQNIITEFEKEHEEVEIDKKESKAEPVSFRGLLKSRILMARCLILFYIWGTNAFVFYGLSINAINLSGNIYLNFILGCLIEIPGNTIAWIVINKFGRKLSLSFSLLACGVTCIAGGFIPQQIFWIQIFLFLFGKMAITSSFTIVFVYSAEMIPTLIRSSVVGTFSTLARFFSLVAPFVPLLQTYYAFLPLLVFGSSAFAAGILALMLPETLGIKLPDTIREAEEIGMIFKTHL